MITNDYWLREQKFRKIKQFKVRASMWAVLITYYGREGGYTVESMADVYRGVEAIEASPGLAVSRTRRAPRVTAECSDKLV